MATRLKQVSVGAPAERRPPPAPEVVEQASRRRFTAKYKLKVLAEAEASDARVSFAPILGPGHG